MKRERRSTSLLTLFSFLLMALSTSTARSQVTAIGPGDFPPGSALLTFTGLADGTEVNGLAYMGVLFSYSLGDGVVTIDGGPGTTDHIAPPNIVSIGNPSGVLTLLLPGFFNVFGYGYAILNTVNVTNATSIALFSGVANVGGLSYDGTPDPLFSGGFAGIQSVTPFDRVEVTFNSIAAPAFALDNIRFGNAATVPEPTTLVLVGTGLVGFVAFARRRRRSLR